MGARAAIKLRAARETDLPRLKTLWRECFPDAAAGACFFERCFVPGHVESSLVLLIDGEIKSMVFFLPTFWYDESHGYGPAPCLTGLATAAKCRRKSYASWLVETACDFMVEKGAGAVWTLLPDDALELFFSMQGFWTMPRSAVRAWEAAALPKSMGTIRRAEPEEYECRREKLLQGKNHIVAGNLVAALQRDIAERGGGGMFLLELPDGIACAIARMQGDTVRVEELLCPQGAREEALSLLAAQLHARRCVEQEGCGMLRLLNRFAEMKQPEGYLGCGPLL